MAPDLTSRILPFGILFISSNALSGRALAKISMYPALVAFES